MKKFLRFAVILFFLCLPFNLYSLNGIEIFSGYLGAKLKDKQDYEAVPLLVAFNFDAKLLLGKVGIRPKGRLDFVVEPFLNSVIAPDANIEAGVDFLIKYDFPLSEIFHMYFKGGAGILYMSQHTREQATQYNFLPQGGAGFHIFLDKNTALSFEYRFRHLSNSDIKYPNRGIDADLILGGISFFF